MSRAQPVAEDGHCYFGSFRSFTPMLLLCPGSFVPFSWLISLVVSSKRNLFNLCVRTDGHAPWGRQIVT
jgi:hypothetical protein